LCQLTESLRPVAIWRAPGRLLLAIDPRSNRIEVITWAADHLAAPEMNAMRAAMDLGPAGTSMPGWITEDAPVPLYVPASARLPGSPPLQGGAELVRRMAADELAGEHAACAREIAGQPVWAGMLATMR
jgi:hypothetical protein